MQIFSSPDSIKAYISKERNHGKTIGLVPTMGALHRGHLELIGQSIQSNDITVCSIYINTTKTVLFMINTVICFNKNWIVKKEEKDRLIK